ncbi:hypothetical protein D3C78_1408420 [compost metagenome]
MKSINPSQVTFSPISVDRLDKGDTREALFALDFECQYATSKPFTSGTGVGAVALGIKVSTSSALAAANEGLRNANGGVSNLLWDQYEQPEYTQGVGIRIHRVVSGNLLEMNLLTTENSVSSLAPANASMMGWYPVLEGLANDGSTPYRQFRRTFTARLEKLPGGEPTPGRVDATAQVLIRIQ